MSKTHQDKPGTAFISYVPGPIALRLISKIHTAIYQMSNGRLSHRLDGLDILLLTTRGRRSGKLYQTPMPYFEHPDGYLLIASNAGSASNPGWFYNLLDHPDISIQVGSEKRKAIASVLNEKNQRVWWQQLINLQPRYAEYQQTTKRVIPIVLLKKKALDERI